MIELLYVNWSRGNHAAISDHNIESWYESILETCITEAKCGVIIASDLQLTRLRVGIVEGELAPFKLLCDDGEYHFDKDGSLLSLCPEIANQNIKLMSRILKWSVK